MKKLSFIMMYTTILIYANRATEQTGKSATDLVEFYADASPPCCKTEFKRQPTHFTMYMR